MRSLDGAARRALCGLVAMLGALLAPALAAQPADVEYAVKATYLYKFAPFVEWPAGTFTNPTDPFVICVAGDDPVGELVGEAVRGQSVGRHPIAAVHLVAGEAPRCNILYVAEHGAAAAGVLARVRGLPVLTVTDDAGSAHAIVNFVVQDHRVRFEIDLSAAAANHLSISSKLLNLALRVVPTP
jgi:hypothetical protein